MNFFTFQYRRCNLKVFKPSVTRGPKIDLIHFDITDFIDGLNIINLMGAGNGGLEFLALILTVLS